ncbi:SapC family protein [Jannaschia seohaensis]|uniref:SapC protein n=1 Tax=Jannaschia seohaensis TaxID=475081 RepID=A0A2Y9APH7_9RHOB|nr:SapC family protein [Jannaschia seohaensis]PWJ20245.1 SapC protein [Jannaschia seohaensis]SSA44249.1 SapC protein [Jannaschia seohaensis]
MKQGLLYERPRPVAKSWHAGWSVNTTGGYGFARELAASPLAAVEFPIAGRDHPIVFVEGEGGLTPLALLGLTEKENLSVEPDGSWSGGYIPAFVRRYPFVLAKDAEKDSYTLCIDEASPACNTDGKGQPLFGPDGEQSDYLKRQLALSREWERVRAATVAFCERLSDLDLLTKQRVSVTDSAGRTSLAGGFSAVDRERLKGLSDETLGELMRAGYLEAIMAHLFSLNGLEALGRKLDRIRKASSKAEAETAH